MIRVLLLTVVPFFTPACLYILWRTFAPVRYGGSASIARDEWEPLPWKWLTIAGAVLMGLAILISILFPDLFAHSGSLVRD